MKAHYSFTVTITFIFSLIDMQKVTVLSCINISKTISNYLYNGTIK